MNAVVSLFSGAGGFDLGLVRAGGSLIEAHELDREGCDIYPEVTGGGAIYQTDLAVYDLAALPDSDGIIGGPPCQEFSSAGHNLGAAGTRNLWPVALKAIKVKRPGWFLFENVSGLIEAKHRPYFNWLLDEFRSFGYQVDWRLFDAADYGIPQNRERVFVAGWRDDRQTWRWPAPTHWNRPSGWVFKRWVSAAEALKTWLAGDLELMPVPHCISKRYPNGIPNNVMLSGDSRNSKLHRPLSEPSYCVTASDRSRHRVYINNRSYRVDNQACGILQTMPPCVTKKHLIGNAVPPAFAEAIFKAAFGGGDEE